jgi:hypothetical protein
MGEEAPRGVLEELHSPSRLGIVWNHETTMADIALLRPGQLHLMDAGDSEALEHLHPITSSSSAKMRPLFGASELAHPFTLTMLFHHFT